MSEKLIIPHTDQTSQHVMLEPLVSTGFLCKDRQQSVFASTLPDHKQTGWRWWYLLVLVLVLLLLIIAEFHSTQ